MPVEIEAPPRISILSTRSLCQDEFSSFGTVIENPAPSIVPSSQITDLPPNAVQANQGSALKYLDVTHMVDLYTSAPSQQAAKPVMNMFVCAPRTLLPSVDGEIDGHFEVKILERHPYTTQTFIPLGLSPLEYGEASYLVVVAPSLAASTADESLPVPEATSEFRNLPGRGLPDLSRLQAFIANGSQAVTYGAGTWHAPMVAIGRRPITFVVVQAANGVALEDCQEAEWKSKEDARLLVAVPKLKTSSKLHPKL
ncbi:ureidoglycolate hydrolase-like protein [Coleophoma cylindrospora]|uniref:Ureidoglycolate hydrolase-like protein n=1 Tax=Coleophoma cylindrospora TaxID=1849047 RepID=A0A3D8SER7_9HELO|nr:ureidoglycolate hydrolase-like protein [Coleophoma cylindrospora]